MKKVLILGLAIAFAGSAAMATDINFSVQSGGSNAVVVSGGAEVAYEVEASLSGTPSEGLALVGFDLEFTGGALTPAAEPTEDPMLSFVIPDGITNPDGYGGTIIDNKLVQVGGGQNTINNYEGNAPFPIGAVITGVGYPDVILATGTLTAPMEAGEYVLSLTNPFANVIKEGEDGDPFWATEEAGIGSIANLTVTVPGVDCTLESSTPAHDESLWRSTNNIVRLVFNCGRTDITEPGPGEVLVQQLLDDGEFAPNLSDVLLFTVEGGTTLAIEDDGQALSHGNWYAIRNTGGWSGVETFEVHLVVQVGDCNNDLMVLPNDLSCINSDIPNMSPPDDSRFEINGDGMVLPNDLSAANSFIPSMPVTKPTGH
jgi:hypothetical protein